MNHTEQRVEMIRILLSEMPKPKNPKIKIKIPTDPKDQRKLLRTLVNLREPKPISEEYLEIEREYIPEENRRRGHIVKLKYQEPISENLYLLKGDISLLQVDAIVNATRENLTGSFKPNHNSLENIIHTYAGVALRLECNKIIEELGHKLEVGDTIITDAYNLPAKKIIHVLGPTVKDGNVTKENIEDLILCYNNILELSSENEFRSVGLSCISTGSFGFPNREAAEIAVKTVKTWISNNPESQMKIVFNPLRSLDFDIYKELLTEK